MSGLSSPLRSLGRGASLLVLQGSGSGGEGFDSVQSSARAASCGRRTPTPVIACCPPAEAKTRPGPPMPTLLRAKETS